MQPRLNHLKDIRVLLALGFGSGLAPVAPGTFGTLAAIPLYAVAASLPLYWYLLGVVLTFIVGVWLCGHAARQLGVADHPAIVWDEIVGYLITMTAVPLSGPGIVAGFVLFRVFDIVKPWPIRWLDRHIKGGLGVMLDDVLAGVFAAIIMFIVRQQGWVA